MKRRAYIDIETTGLSRQFTDLTVIGIGVETGGTIKFVQLIEEAVNPRRLLKELSGVDEIYTYNGSRFDLPFITEKLHIDLKKIFRHTDLMYRCWKHNLKGGLKAVERKLGIGREVEGIDGRMAVWLWWDYVNNHDRSSLDMLLAYNREDVLNLRTLRIRLAVD